MAMIYGLTVGERERLVKSGGRGIVESDGKGEVESGSKEDVESGK